MPKTILVVDDSQTMRSMVSAILTRGGHRTVTAADGYEALQVLYREKPHLVILDIMMPRMDGLETLRRIRELSGIPVLILSAKSEEDDIVLAFEEGADDFVTKPFGKRELLARVEALLRRSGTRSQEGFEGVVSVCGGDIVIEAQSRHVAVQGTRVKLTPREYDLLHLLALNAGAVLPHETIIRRVWGYDYEGNIDNLKLYVWYLRRKIEPDPKQPRYLLTERGVGYRLAR